MDVITFQPELRPELPDVFATKDYREFRATLVEMDRILSVSGLEHHFITRQIKNFEESADKPFSPWRAQRHGWLAWPNIPTGVRYGILLAITTESFRKLSRQVADSLLFQWFTHTAFVDGVRPISKSTLERFDKIFPESELATLIHEITGAAADAVVTGQLLYRETALCFDEIFADFTCVKAAAETEFGNGLYLAEQSAGLIVDWEFIQEQPTSDSKLVKSSLTRITENYGQPASYTGDRGFDSPKSREYLDELGLINGICPRSVPSLKEKFEDENFCLLQKRRGSVSACLKIPISELPCEVKATPTAKHELNGVSSATTFGNSPPWPRKNAPSSKPNSPQRHNLS